MTTPLFYFSPFERGKLNSISANFPPLVMSLNHRGVQEGRQPQIFREFKRDFVPLFNSLPPSPLKERGIKGVRLSFDSLVIIGHNSR
jgi:hypothetical protein